MLGEKFDVLERGTHVFVQIPRGADPQHTLLRIEANVTGGKTCAYTFITNVVVTGKWAAGRNPEGILQYAARPFGRGKRGKQKVYLPLGPVVLKIAHGSLPSGLTYLNLKVHHLSTVDLPVGGLLGVDDHTNASTPVGCLADPAYNSTSREEEVEAGSATVSAV